MLRKHRFNLSSVQGDKPCHPFRKVPILVWFFLLIVLVAGAIKIYHKAIDLSYPLQYNEIVEYWAEEYQVDPLLVFSVIRTESGFDKNAQSNVDARGLMQITSDTFDWIKSKIAPNEEIVFEDLYQPEVAIRFGTYYLSRCLLRYENDIPTATAAYHSGWGTVDGLLVQEKYSSDGIILDEFPYTQMNHYVSKIASSYEKYNELYNLEKDVSQ